MFEARAISSAETTHKDAGGNPSVLRGSSIRKIGFVHARMHTSLLKHFPTDLPEVILLESAPAAKEFKIGLGLLASIKLNSRKLDAAYVIGGLRQQIVLGDASLKIVALRPIVRSMAECIA